MLLWKSLSFIAEAGVAKHSQCITVKLCPGEYLPPTPPKKEEHFLNQKLPAELFF